jgi:hypothetical protein
VIAGIVMGLGYSNGSVEEPCDGVPALVQPLPPDSVTNADVAKPSSVNFVAVGSDRVRFEVAAYSQPGSAGVVCTAPGSPAALTRVTPEQGSGGKFEAPALRRLCYVEYVVRNTGSETLHAWFQAAALSSSGIWLGGVSKVEPVYGKLALGAALTLR